MSALCTYCGRPWEDHGNPGYQHPFAIAGAAHEEDAELSDLRNENRRVVMVDIRAIDSDPSVAADVARRTTLDATLRCLRCGEFHSDTVRCGEVVLHARPQPDDQVELSEVGAPTCVVHVVGGEPMRCGYCGELALELYSFNPDATPDICQKCYDLAATAERPVLPDTEVTSFREAEIEIARLTRDLAALHAERDQLENDFDDLVGQSVKSAIMINDLRALLLQIRGWDIMDATADGPFWRTKIDTLLQEQP